MSSSNEEGSQSDGSDGGNGEIERDGLADVISKIVGQSVSKTGTAALPILAKRKTTNVKAGSDSDDEEERKSKVRKRKKVASIKTSGREVDLSVALSGDRITKERSLRKIATKGVLALFNAIVKSKREGEQEEEALKNGSKLARKTMRADKDKLKRKMIENVKAMTKDNYDKLIQNDLSSKSQTDLENISGNGDDSDGEESQKKGDAKGWSVLQDDDMVLKNTTLSLKDWDKDEDI